VSCAPLTLDFDWDWFLDMNMDWVVNDLLDWVWLGHMDRDLDDFLNFIRDLACEWGKVCN
jgi:hypothetical protein